MVIGIISVTLGAIITIGYIVRLIVKAENTELKSNIEKKFGFIQSAINNIVSSLEKAGIKVNKLYFVSESPKKITKSGYELLDKLNISSYLDDSCNLLKDHGLKNKTDVEIFIVCFDWVKEQAKEKAFELRFNSNMNQEESNELLALFILDKIKKQSTQKPN